MAIELKVDPFCENCPEFEPDVDKDIIHYELQGDKCYTTIKCEHQGRCKSMYMHLYNVYNEEKMKEKQNEA